MQEITMLNDKLKQLLSITSDYAEESGALFIEKCIELLRCHYAKDISKIDNPNVVYVTEGTCKLAKIYINERNELKLTLLLEKDDRKLPINDNTLTYLGIECKIVDKKQWNPSNPRAFRYMTIEPIGISKEEFIILHRISTAFDLSW